MPVLAATRVPRGRSAMWQMKFCGSSASKPIRCSTPTGRNMHISRTKAYQWLARELKLSEEETHIGGFEIDTCQRVIDLCRAKMDNVK